MRKVCPTCGKEFETNYSHQIYCSKQCNSRAKNARHRKLPKFAKCIVCGKEFQKFGNRRICCSKECYEKHIGKGKKLKREMTPTAICFIRALASIENGQEFLSSLKRRRGKK